MIEFTSNLNSQTTWLKVNLKLVNFLKGMRSVFKQAHLARKRGRRLMNRRAGLQDSRAAKEHAGQHARTLASSCLYLCVVVVQMQHCGT